MNEYGDTGVIKTRSGVTLDDLELGHTSATDGDFDSFIQDLNQRVSAILERVLGRDFTKHENEVETLDGNEQDTLLVSNRPVLTTHHIKIDGTEETVPDDARLTSAGVLEKRLGHWPDGWRNIEVKYDYGYESVPLDVKSFVESLCVRSLQSAAKAKKTGGANSINMDGYSITYGVEFDSMVALQAQESQALEKYKLVRTV